MKKKNWNSYINSIVNKAGKYFSKNHFKCMILNMDGSIESMVTAYIANKISETYNISLYGFTLYSEFTNKELLKAACMSYAFCVFYDEINLEPIYKNYISYMRINKLIYVKDKDNALIEKDIRARIGSMFLYDFANMFNGVVLDYNSLSDKFLGSYTIHGNEGDLSFVGKLWESEIYKLINWIYTNDDKLLDPQIKAIKASINAYEPNNIYDIEKMDSILKIIASGTNPLESEAIENLNKLDIISESFIKNVYDCYLKNKYKIDKRPVKL